MLYADIGRVDEARASAAEGVEAAEAVADEMFGPAALAALGHAELVAGDPERAAGYLRHLPERLLRTSGQGALSSGWGDAVEALIRIGELDVAADHLEQWSTVVWTRLARIGLLRCTGLLADARGDSLGAVDALEQAVTADDPPTYPFERARTLLALGAVHRHALQRRAARSTLEEALATFEHLGAVPWAARARDELRRVSGRRPSGELTEAELRVATLAAAGRRNKEIATALFIGVGTVESHLSRVYRKLAVRSRTELSARLAEAGDGTSKV
jgi:DNA-binding CsgD family transcriptional regulator